MEGGDSDNGDRSLELERVHHGDPYHQQPPDDIDRNRKSQTWIDLRGRPVKKSKTGAWKAAPSIYGLQAAQFGVAMFVTVTLVQYLVLNMHQSISKASTTTSNFTGTSNLLAVLGGFLADSYVGYFWMIVGGVVGISLGLGLMTISAAYSKLQPAKCVAGPMMLCKPAGARYMAPVYVALYTMAVGFGLAQTNVAALGANQFDEYSPVERKQSVHFFIWFYFFSNVGVIIAYGPGVYLENNVSARWGYGFALICFAVLTALSFLGTCRIRHKPPTGSFLTRVAQVLVAAVRKRNVQNNSEGNYDQLDDSLPPNFSQKLPHTDEIRFLDRAAIIDESPVEIDNQHVDRRSKPLNPWRLCSVTQVEETKRILKMLPIWACTIPIYLLFTELTTFSIQQIQTLDRRLGSHFVIPPASVYVIGIMFTLLSVPLYDTLLNPIVRRLTGHPYGLTALQQLGMSIVFAALAMMTAALLERKRLTYVRELHLQAFPLGTYTLPMTFWWFLPLLFLTAQNEICLFVSSYEFFYYEASEETRSIGSSFRNSSLAVGSFLSTVLVNVTNRVTRNQKNGSWLEGQLNNGGLEKFYWLLSVLLVLDFLVFLVCASLYRYNYYRYQKRPKDSNPVVPVEEDYRS